MHNLFLGELHHHCVKIWGLKTAEERTDNPKQAKQAAEHTPEMQQAVLDQLVAALRKGSLKTGSAIRKDYLEAMVKFNPSIPISKPAPTKADYAAALSDWVARVAGGVDSLVIPPVLPYATSRFHGSPGTHGKADDPFANSIFTGEVLEAVRKDIASATLPSWLPRPPRNLGSASHGKLKADQWRTACTVNMVITLVRLWGGSAATDEEKLALTNFLHLVAAVDLATRHTMSAERAHRFDYHMLEYIRGIRTIYNAKLVPNHHLSLHLVDCLLLFGPTFAWWAFPFERYNGLIQRYNKNHKTAEMPKTFMRFFYIGAKLRWMIATESKTWPDSPEFQQLQRAFDSAFQDAARGSRIIDMSVFSSDGHDDSTTSGRAAGKEQSLDRRFYEVLLNRINSRIPPHAEKYASRYDQQDGATPFLPSTAVFLPSIVHAGVTISTSQDRPGNSFVLFRKEGSNTSGVSAGQVQRIFQHARLQEGVSIQETYLVVREFKPLGPSHLGRDPYRKFPDVEAWLCYNETFDTEIVIPLAHFVSHFASYIYTPAEIGRECIVVKSLDRVSL
ncbi:hypothetical protein PYCCODRAFT_1368558 [Trametes coccinea BRFM310]|uniref:DUF4218 domain-containing protein n=1 Tax=Trametes coccinea (strain BRFM310) TaxID=1353009 RepID=A0A1Y2ILI1_TRAC3|nr:hypothetical protein PYCCODRAFT_1368558 [Trametes coccinea BRFM310]